MKLTTRSRYGTRALLNLAENYGNGPIFLHETARKEGISEKYLQQLFHTLKVVGIIKSERGVKGGFSLAKDPSNIQLSEVITVLEGPLTLSDCVADEFLCSKTSSCATRELWKRMNAALMGVLESMTLKDLVNLQSEKECQHSASYHI